MSSLQEEIYLGKKEKERERDGRGKRMIDGEIRREGRKREKEERGRMEEAGRMGETKEKQRQGERKDRGRERGWLVIGLGYVLSWRGHWHKRL